MHGLIRIVEGKPHALPLVRVAVRASLLDLSAGISVEQEYRNDGNDTAECSYRFPVPARAAVCAFAMRKEDGTRVVGTVQEKEEARVTYDDAVSQGKFASLMEQDSPDAFTTSVGNILPGETVVVELTYVTELTEGETNDSIRFHIPAHVGARYGDPPSTNKVAPAAATGSTFFSVDVSIEAAAPISKINCPSHAVSTDLGPDPSLPNAADLPIPNFARVACKLDLALSRDFVLEITSAGLDRPRCFVEHHPSEDTAAVSLTVVPRFQLPEVTGQEFVFLVDRSGSMGPWGASPGGERIALARKALVVLLRSLPHQDTTFNIVSFGSSHEALWKKGSRAYNQRTLDEATRLVDSMEANFGGTEIRAALESVFRLRDQKRPTSVFVLTDGDAWDLDGVVDSVKSAVSASSSAAPLRVFSLGIGNSASTAMCDALARVGHGIAQYVSDGESFTGKTARLLKAARTPQILNARLDFGVDESVTPSKEKSAEDDFELVEPPKHGDEGAAIAEKVKSLSLFDEAVDPLAAPDKQGAPAPEPAKLPPPSPIQLAPHKIQNLYPGSRLHAYGIVTPASLLGEKATLRGELATGEQLALDVPIVAAHVGVTSTSNPGAAPPLLHALAARKLIQELEDGSHVLKPPSTDGDLAARTLKAAVVRLGKQYSLASRHTSFVAVDEADLAAGKVRKPVARVVDTVNEGMYGGAPGGGGGGAMRRCMAMPLMAPVGPPAPLPVSTGRQAPRAAFLACAAPPPPPPLAQMCAPVPAAAAHGGVRHRAAQFAPDAADTAQPKGGFGVALKSAFGGSSFAKKKAAPTAVEEAAAPAPAAEAKPAAPPTPTDTLELLARAQSFAGSFAPAALAALPGAPRVKELVTRLLGAYKGARAEEVATTLAVLAYLEREMEGERDAWEAMGEKARSWVAGELGIGEGEVEKLVEGFA
ncbi:hypothetical protein JCM10449v2_003017 [Rhodotorula kratochvilovae]